MSKCQYSLAVGVTSWTDTAISGCRDASCTGKLCCRSAEL